MRGIGVWHVVHARVDLNSLPNVLFECEETLVEFDSIVVVLRGLLRLQWGIAVILIDTIVVTRVSAIITHEKNVMNRPLFI